MTMDSHSGGPVPGFPPIEAAPAEPPGTLEAPVPEYGEPAAPGTVPDSRWYPPAVPVPPPARTGAFADVRTRWLILWALIGAFAVEGIGALVAAVFDLRLTDELSTALLYLPIAAWILVMVARRAHVDLRALLRWPRLGRYWGVVAGMFVVQFLFSLGAATLTQLVAPGLDDSLEGVGQGNLLIALLGIVVLPPLVEETLFRGVFIERFAVKWSLRVAILTSAVFFGILHVDPVGAGMFGVITALLYVRTRSLWPGIVIHFTNNLVALIAIRGTGTSVEEPPADVASALVTAGVFLLFSVPFLVWFLWTHWPARGTLTPYQAHELAVGLPERTFGSVAWSGAPMAVRLTASPTHLVVTPMGGAAPMALLPVEQVSRVYSTGSPGAERAVLLLHDGSWTTLHVLGGVRATDHLVRTIAERAEQADYRWRSSA